MNPPHRPRRPDAGRSPAQAVDSAEARQSPTPAWAFDLHEVDRPVAASTTTAAGVGQQLGALRGAAQRRWPGFTRTARFRLAVLVLATVVAYHYSLQSLMRTLGLDTPLAYLGLVPFMALGLGVMRGRPRPGEPDIHDRQVDVIVGVPLVLLALGVVYFLPERLDTLFWVYRLDLLSMPVFVAGLVALLFGVRTVARLRFPLAFLFLAWPFPFQWALDHGLTGFTEVTLTSLRTALDHVPINATNIAGSDGSLFLIGSGANAFQVSVASACAGVDGVVGFLLVGVAFATLVEGRRLPKFLWLISGLALIYSLNLSRILLLFWAGDKYGESVAIDGLHPFIGLVLFCVGVVAMILVMGRFGLKIAAPAGAVAAAQAAAPRRPSGPATGGSAVVTGGLTGLRARRALAASRRAERAAARKAPRVRPARAPQWQLSTGFKAVGVLTAMAALALGAANSGFSRFELVAGDLGAPRLASFAAAPAQVGSYSVSQTNTYEWAQRFFGRDSTWRRYLYSGRGGAALGGQPVYADVIETSSLRSFSAYGIEACYRFHGYEIVSKKPVQLGGVRGEMITYNNYKEKQSWNALYWIWPVKTDKGTRYERVVLLTQAPLAGQAQVVSASTGSPGARNLASTQEYLQGFAQQVIDAKTAATKVGSGSSTSTALGR